MEKEFWLQRQRESGEMARSATSAEARLIHLDLAGRYSIEAAAVGLKSGSGRRASRSEGETEGVRP